MRESLGVCLSKIYRQMTHCSLCDFIAVQGELSHASRQLKESEERIQELEETLKGTTLMVRSRLSYALFSPPPPIYTYFAVKEKRCS